MSACLSCIELFRFVFHFQSFLFHDCSKRIVWLPSILSKARLGASGYDSSGSKEPCHVLPGEDAFKTDWEVLPFVSDCIDHGPQSQYTMHILDFFKTNFHVQLYNSCTVLLSEVWRTNMTQIFFFFSFFVWYVSDDYNFGSGEPNVPGGLISI